MDSNKENATSQLEFQFVTFQTGEILNDREKQRTARSHAGRQSHKTRRSRLVQNLDHFKITTPNDMTVVCTRQSDQQDQLSNPTIAIAVHRLDPFDSLAVDSSRLHELIRHPYAQQSVEPVFSISDPYSFYNVHDAYRNGFADPAFANALVCAISFAKQASQLSPEVLIYRGEAMRHISKQLGKLESLDCTIGAILLLIGIEWRLGLSEVAQMHLKGIDKMLQNYTSNHTRLSASTRRGIFWQDLNTAIVTNTDRVFSRATFPEFQWGTAFKVSWTKLPAGFESAHDLLSSPVRQILQDLYVFQISSEGVGTDATNIDAIHNIDNQQACVEARIQESLQSLTTPDNLLTCVLLAAYLFSYSLFTSVWDGYAIPQYLSARLLDHLRKVTSDDSWILYEHIVFWCTMTGGSLSPLRATREGFANLLPGAFWQWNGYNHDSWDIVELSLNNFLWSTERFKSRGKEFLETVNIQEVQINTLIS